MPDFIRNHAAGFAPPFPEDVAPPAPEPLQPIDRRFMSSEPAPSRYIGPTLLLLSGMAVFTYGLVESEDAALWLSASLLALAGVLVRANYVSRIDMQHQREAIADAQGKNNNTRI